MTAILLRTCCLENFVKGKFNLLLLFGFENDRNLYAIYCSWTFRESSTKYMRGKRWWQSLLNLATANIFTSECDKNESRHMVAVEEQENMCQEQGVKSIASL